MFLRVSFVCISLICSLLAHQKVAASPAILLLSGAPENAEERAIVALGLEDAPNVDAFGLRNQGKTASLPFFLMPMHVSGECGDGPYDIDGSLRDAYDALDFLDLSLATQKLGLIKKAIKCGETLPTAAQLGRLFFAIGVFEVYDGRPGTRHFADAMSLGSELPNEMDYPQAVVDSFKAGQRLLADRGRHQVLVEGQDLPGIDLYIDGRQVQGSSLYLPLGTHLVGWGTASGRHMGSQMVAVLESDPDPLTWPPVLVTPPPLTELSQQLETAVSAGRLSGDLEKALLGWMSYENMGELLLVGAGGEALLLEQGAPSRSLLLPEEKTRSFSSKKGIAIGTGALALACGGYYTYAYRRLSTEVFTSEETLTAFRRKGQVVGALGVGLLLTSGTFVGLSYATSESDEPAFMAQVGGTW